MKIYSINFLKKSLKISKPDLNYIKNWAEKQSTSEILEGVIKKIKVELDKN